MNTTDKKAFWMRAGALAMLVALAVGSILWFVGPRSLNGARGALGPKVPAANSLKPESLRPEFEQKAFLYPVKLQAAAKSCETPSAWNQFPPVTNWKNGTGFEFGAQDPYREVSACADRGARFGAREMPGVEAPTGASFSVLPGLLADGKNVETWLARMGEELCRESGFKVRYLKAGNVKSVRDEVKKNPGTIHVILGSVIEGSYSILILPPDWKPSDGAGKHPILTTGGGDALEILSKDGDFLLRLIAESAQGSKRKSFMGLIWNGGGSAGTLSAQAHTRYQFSRILAMAEEDWGGDRQNVIAFGASASATTALMMAANPENFDYRIRYVHAVAPILKFGSWIDLSQNALPMGPYALLETGFSRSWAPGWTYPKDETCSERSELYGLNASAALRKILLNQDESARIDEHYSLTAERLVHAVKNQGVNVFLDVGTADGYAPFAHAYEYFRKLKALRVPVEVKATLRQGHHGSDSGGARLREAMLVIAENRPRKFLENGEMKVFEVSAPGTAPTENKPYSERLPVTVLAPVRAVQGWSTQFLLTGPSGTEFEVVFKRGDVTLAPENWFRVWTGKFNDYGTAKIDFVPEEMDGGHLKLYSLRTKELLQPWKTLRVDGTNTSNGAPLQTFIVPWSGDEMQIDNFEAVQRTYATALEGGEIFSQVQTPAWGAGFQLIATESVEAPALTHEKIIEKIRDQFAPVLEIVSGEGRRRVQPAMAPVSVVETRPYQLSLQLQGYPAGRIKSCRFWPVRPGLGEDCQTLVNSQEMTLTRPEPGASKQALILTTVDGKEARFEWDVQSRVMTLEPSLKFVEGGTETVVTPRTPGVTALVREARPYEVAYSLGGYPAARLVLCEERNLTLKTARDCRADFANSQVHRFRPESPSSQAYEISMATSEGQKVEFKYTLEVKAKPLTMGLVIESKRQKIEMGPGHGTAVLTLSEGESYTLTTQMRGYPAAHVASCQWRINGAKAQDCRHYFEGDKRVPSVAGQAGKTEHRFAVQSRDGQVLEFALTIEVLKKAFAPQIKIFGANQDLTLISGEPESVIRLAQGEKYALTVKLNGFMPKKIKSCVLKTGAGASFDCLGYFQKPQTYSFQAGQGPSTQVFHVETDEGETAEFKLKIDSP